MFTNYILIIGYICLFIIGWVFGGKFSTYLMDKFSRKTLLRITHKDGTITEQYIVRSEAIKIKEAVEHHKL